MHNEPTAATHWDAAVATGLLRIGAGLSLLRWRSFAIRMCGGSADDPVMRGVFVYFGLRDISIGVHALTATRPGSDVPRQLAIQGLADSSDTALLGGLLATGRLSRVRGAGAVALAAVTALGGFFSSWKLRRLS